MEAHSPSLHVYTTVNVHLPFYRFLIRDEIRYTTIYGNHDKAIRTATRIEIYSYYRRQMLDFKTKKRKEKNQGLHLFVSVLI